MITIEKLKIYRNYGGDIDGWTRVNSKREHSIMSDQDWYEIDYIIQEISLIKSGHASKEYENKIMNGLNQKVADKYVLDELYSLA